MHWTTDLKEMGFKQTSGDPYLHVHLDSEGEMFFIAVYVDDIILGRRQNECSEEGAES
jgi:hypothetical protein